MLLCCFTQSLSTAALKRGSTPQLNSLFQVAPLVSEAVTEASEKLMHAAAAAKEKLGGAGTALSARAPVDSRIAWLLVPLRRRRPETCGSRDELTTPGGVVSNFFLSPSHRMWAGCFRAGEGLSGPK